MILKNYPVWIDSPNLKQQHNFDYAMPVPLKNQLFRLFGNPFILFQIRDCLIHLLDQNQLFIVDQSIISILVFIAEDEFAKLESQINAKSEKIVELICYWLNEQVAIYGYQFGKQWPSISTVVIKNDEDYLIEDSDFSELDFFQCKIFNQLSHFLQKQILHGLPDQPRFWVRFPKKGKKGSHTMGLEVVVPIQLQTGDNRRIFVNNTGKTIIGSTFFSKINNTFLHKLELLSTNHAELGVTIVNWRDPNAFATNHGENIEIEQLWIRHIGSHESWLHHKTWNAISREKWEPIVPGDRVVLGRVVEERSNLFRIVPGSLMLRVISLESEEASDDDSLEK